MQGKLVPSSVALSALVSMEMLRALCSVSNTESLFVKPPWANSWLLAGVVLPMVLHIGVLYTRPLANTFQVAPLTQQNWKTVVLFALPLVFLEEALKLGARCLNTE